MVKKNYKGRCVKISSEKAKEICRTYNDIQLAYLKKMEADETVAEIQCNTPLNGEDIGEFCKNIAVNNGIGGGGLLACS